MESPEEFLATNPSPYTIQLNFHHRYDKDDWYRALRPLVHINQRCLTHFAQQGHSERYYDLIQDVHHEYFTLPIDTRFGSLWPAFMTCAARISAQEFVTQVNAFIQKPLVREQSLRDFQKPPAQENLLRNFQKPAAQEQSLRDFQNSHANPANPQDFQKGDSIGESFDYAEAVFDWLNGEYHWFTHDKNSSSGAIDCDNIAILLLPIAIRYGITYQSHRRFFYSSTVMILSRGPYESVQQWTSVYGLQFQARTGICPVKFILCRPQCAQMIVLMKECIKQARGSIFLFIHEWDSLSMIVNEVPRIALDVVRQCVSKETKYDITERAQRYIAMCQSSLNEYVIPPMVSIVMDYID
jgi:hypothetical protein